MKMLLVLGSLVIALGLSGCAHLTVREQQAVDASVICGTSLLSTSLGCYPTCSNIADKAAKKKCNVDCVVSTLKTSLPICGENYGGIYSEAAGAAIDQAVDSVFAIYEAFTK